MYLFIYLSVYSLFLLGFIKKEKKNSNDKNSWSQGFMGLYVMEVYGLESRMIAPCNTVKH